MIDDSRLPGLRDMAPEALERMTGWPGATLLRLRYREGKRAILHVGSPEGEGVLWFFAGDKARKVARRSRAARLDVESGAVFEAFPDDHRLPEIAELLRRWPGVAPELTGSAAVQGLDLLRYRPGLSATFRTHLGGASAAYVKVTGDEDVSALAEANRRASARLSGGPLAIAPVLGVLPALKTLAYAGAGGKPLDALLQQDPDGPGLARTLAALDLLHRGPIFSARIMDAGHLRATAQEAGAFLCTLFPALSDLTARILARLDTLKPPGDLRQIHGDIKLEHVFIDSVRTTLIDTESMARGPAGHDLAMLAGRLVMAAQEGRIMIDTARRGRAQIAASAGDGFGWCLAVVALLLARFHAQRPGPGAEGRAAALLRDIP